MLALFRRELPEHGAAARVLGHLSRPRVELQAAPLGRNRDAERVAGEHTFGRCAIERGCGGRSGSLLAVLAGAMDLHHRLAGLESSGRRHLFDERLDIRAEELGGTVARAANQMKMMGMFVRGLEARPTFAEV